MSWSTVFLLALRALWRNKVRAILTSLGVIIGVGSVITMVAIGTGAQQSIAKQLEKMGSLNLVVRPGSITRGGVRKGAGGRKSLVKADADAIKELAGVVAVSPTVRTTAQVRYRGTNWGTTIEGVTEDYQRVKSWDLTSGDFITQRDVNSGAHVCVLGETVARELFGLENPLDQTIVVKGLACRIVGVLAQKGASAWGHDLDDKILLPLSTVQRKIMGISHVKRIEVQTASRDDAFRVFENIAPLLRVRHGLDDKQGNDFRLYNRAELAKTSEENAAVFSWLLGSIASVSLFVGGIGIMNIMLVSVTERTREIGIRLALGAKRKDILWQFLLEAIVLSGAGGIVGIILGVGSALLMREFTEFSISITYWSIIVSFLFATIIGVFFGLHPARKASQLRPIDALRYE